MMYRDRPSLLRPLMLAMAVSLLAAAPVAQAQTGGLRNGNVAGKSVEGRYASINGLRMYYEVHGTGSPLVLLHGGLGTIDLLFGQLLPPLARSRRVIAVELQGHGHTADIDRPLSFEQMADDVAALIEHLGLERADVFGFSLGGLVAQQLGVRHPDVVRKLVVASAPYRSDGWYPEVRAGMAAMDAQGMVGTPLHEAYVRVAPQPRDWPTLVAKTRELLTGTGFDWTVALSRIKAPTLIVVGDADNVSPAHAAAMFELLGGGKADGAMRGRPSSELAVLAGLDHFTILTRADLLVPIVTRFLDADARPPAAGP
jgi:pimeloyl-ACP methyl ester carboxylesterase